MLIRRSPLQFALLVAVSLPIQSLVQTAEMPDWQKAAGGKMDFDFASVRLDASDVIPPASFPLSADDGSPPSGGIFRADFQLIVYIQFAYKIWPSREQTEAMLATLPEWARTDRFLIEARYPNKPTKDQVRLMMQSLLVDRFGLKAHFETRSMPVLAMTLAKPGRLGPRLQPHVDSPECADPVAPDAPLPKDRTLNFPFACGTFQLRTLPDQTAEVGARNITMALLASSLSTVGALGRPVIDQTGMTGRYDFNVIFSQEPTIAATSVSPSTDARPDTPGTTFLEAVREQLGLRLERTNAPVQALVIDRIEKLTEN
jgi:bla regulator protein blaR1